MGPSARVILDSLHPDGVSRVTTMEVVLWRFTLSEFNTHRWSRNSASSRAIPLAKQIERVKADPAIPVSFPAERKGMQGGEELTGAARQDAIRAWLTARDQAVALAEYLGDLGVHKSVANRLLEPFLWHTVICTAHADGGGASYANFWALRCNPLAQPEMRAAAEAMKAAYERSKPGRLMYGDWHLPLVEDYDYYELLDRHGNDDGMEKAKRISAARCARVSYLTHDGRRDWEADLALAERLANPGDGAPHASPFEHVCRPLTDGEPQRGNLIGWRQFRHDLEGGIA